QAAGSPGRSQRPRRDDGQMFIHKWDEGSEEEARAWLATQGFGELVASGRDRDVAIVVPTQFVFTGDTVLVHFLRQNPVWAAVEENPNVLLSVSGDWAFIPSDWKVVRDEDPRLGIPTTYYAAVQVTGIAQAIDDPEGIAEVLRAQLAVIQPGVDIADPAEHGSRLGAIRAMRIEVTAVRAKFKYGGNVDEEHRLVVAEHLEARHGPGDLAAEAHLRRRLD
ncbi:MAG: FMN-binding negative transcriptional regulator, partial [Acidimicrobiales bacterium]